MEEREEGEISLEDVSSSDEGPYAAPYDRSSQSRRYHPVRETVHGKENRHYSREVFTTRYGFPTLHEKNDDLHPISSDDDIEVIELPDSSRQLRIRVSRKKRRKKKKKKNTAMVYDDYVSVNDIDPPVLDLQRSPIAGEVRVYRSRQSLSPRPPRYSPPFDRNRNLSRSPPRSPMRSPPRMSHTAFRRSPSPRSHYSRSRSPRRKRSLRRSPVFRRERSPRRHHSPEPYHDLYASSLLKKVRRLENVGASAATGNKPRETKSLKEKLSNMMQRTPSPPQISPLPNKQSEGGVDGEEDNLEVLRNLALSTKHQKNELKTEFNQNNDKKSSENQSDHHSIEPNHLSDNDHEDLELRMIALKSAVLKKHQKRVKTNARKKNPFNNDRAMSPLGLKEEERALQNDEISAESRSQVEDMELETDIEDEQDCRPYSPTDDVMQTVVAVDVAPVSEIKREAKTEEDAPYSPTDPTKTRYIDGLKKERKRIEEIILDSDSCGETPYSPSDTPVYDPELPSCPPEFLIPPSDTVLDLSIRNRESNSVEREKVTEVNVKVEPDADLDGVPMEIEETGEKDKKQEENQLELTNNGSFQLAESNQYSVENAENSRNSVKSTLSLSDILLNSLNENSPTAPLEKNSQRVAEVTGEPLYLRGIPGVTKEPNKIPTLVNRSLVPVSILKTNKNLQQPLPQKKMEAQVEPSFRSAQMQPVENEPTTLKSASFKPIKLQSVIKKPAVLPPPPEFNNSLLEEAEKLEEVDTKMEKNHDNDKNEEIPKIQEDKGSDVNDTDTSRVEKESCTSETEKNSKRKKKKPVAKLKAKKIQKSSLAKKESIPHETAENISEKLVPVIDKPENRENMEIPGENGKISENLPAEGSESAKRSHSIEEDEETLRAILLASLAKRPKVAETAQKSSNNAPEALKNNEISQKTPETLPKVITNSVTDKKSISHVSVSEKIPENSSTTEVVGKPKNNSTPVVKSINSTVVIEKQANPPAPIEKTATLVINETRKRASSLPMKGPPRKIVKSIPVSTKVVNNAKKFQNTILQKKLILQNQTKLISASKNLVLNNVKPVEVTKSSVSDKVQRLVINLGEDSDTESESSVSSSSRNNTLRRTELAIPTNDFEKSIDQFLKDQRQKHEMMSTGGGDAKSIKNPVKSAPQKNVSMTSTPLAVRHLPLSKQEEYKRLKQQILEKERQRANRQVTASNTPPGPLSPAAQPTKLTPPMKNTSISLKNMTTSTPEAKAVQTLKKAPQTHSTTKNLTPETSKISTVNEKMLVVSNSSSSTRKVMENLSIQIPNDNLSTGVRIVAKKSENIEKTLQKVSEKSSELNVHKELEKTGDTSSKSFFVNNLDKTLEKSLDIKLENSSLQVPNVSVERATKIIAEASEKSTSASKVLTAKNIKLKVARVRLERIDLKGTTFNQNNYMGELPSRIDDCDNSAKNHGDFNDTNNQNRTNDATVDSQASTVILSLREVLDKSQSDSGESTVVLDNTVEERSVLRSPRSRNRAPGREQAERIRSDVKAELEVLVTLSEEEQRQRLKDVEENLVKKRYSILDDLTDMSSTLRQWDVERELQTNLANEVKRLRAQLKVAEKRLVEQRLKIDEITPKVTSAHKTISTGRAECLKLTKLCQGIGNRVVGQEYKVPATAAQLMMERLKEVASHTRQLSRKKVPYGQNNNLEDSSSADESSVIRERTMSLESVSSDNEQCDENIDNIKSEVGDDTSAVVISRLNQPVTDNQPNDDALRPVNDGPTNIKEKRLMSPYESVFTNVVTPRHIDLHRELCPFELGGQCKDADCRYNHLDGTRKQ